MNIQKLQLENEMLKQLVKYGKIFVNYSSSDCDGGYSGGHITFENIDDVYKWEADEAEWADGPFGWSLANPDELQENYKYFTR
jgi:GH43 family beta-xylosidase